MSRLIYNKHTPASVKRRGCHDCGQRHGNHAVYCAYNPTRQTALARAQAAGAEALRWEDVWAAISALQQRLERLERGRGGP